MSHTIYTKLNQLHDKYYTHGNYLLDIPDKYTFGKGSEYEVYKKNAGGIILESRLKINILNKDIDVIIHKPASPIHRYEFEYYFGFGGHCSGYDENKSIICCPSTPICPIKELESLLQNTTHTINKELFCQVCLLMLLGGYINSMVAIDEISTFWKEEFQITELTRDDIFEYLISQLIN